MVFGKESISAILNKNTNRKHTMQTKSENKIDTKRDHMPSAVAVEMLASPEVKQTRKDRRECRNALDTVRPSARPIVRAGKDYEYAEFKQPANVNDAAGAAAPPVQSAPR
jgi:hypothetical protein